MYLEHGRWVFPNVPGRDGSSFCSGSEMRLQRRLLHTQQVPVQGGSLGHGGSSGDPAHPRVAAAGGPVLATGDASQVEAVPRRAQGFAPFALFIYLSIIPVSISLPRRVSHGGVSKLKEETKKETDQNRPWYGNRKECSHTREPCSPGWHSRLVGIGGVCQEEASAHLTCTSHSWPFPLIRQSRD